MKKAVLLLAVLFTSCLTGDPKADLLATQKTFASTVRSLASFKAAGKFSEEEIKNITVVINQGNEALKEWGAAVKAGEDSPDLKIIANRALTLLLAWDAEARRN